MPSSYPGALDNLNDATRPTLTHREVTEAIEAIQSTLGTNPGIWQNYTPVWTSTGTAPVLGNGSLTGRYTKIGKTVHFKLRLTFGSTTSAGTGSWWFTLPLAASTTLPFFNSAAQVLDFGTKNYGPGFMIQVDTGGGYTRFQPITDNTSGIHGAITNTFPHTWGNQDEYTVAATYEIA